MARIYFNIFILDALQEKAKTHECWLPFLQKYDGSLVNTPSLWRHSFFSISFLMAFIWACFLLDTLGDTEGGKNAIWIFIVGGLIPLLIYGWNVCRSHLFDWMIKRLDTQIRKTNDPHDQGIRASEVELRFTSGKSYSSSGVSTVENPMLTVNSSREHSLDR